MHSLIHSFIPRHNLRMRGRLAAISSWTLGEWCPIVCYDDIIEIDWLHVKVVYLNDWERRADAETTQNVFQH